MSKTARLRRLLNRAVNRTTETLIETAPAGAPHFAHPGPMGGQSLFADWQLSATRIMRRRLDEVTFDPGLALFGKGNTGFADMLYTQPQSALQMFTERAALPAIASDHIVWAGFDHWHTNYYHWMTHTLPAAADFMAHAERRDLFLVPPLTPWQAESLDLLGLSSTKRFVVEPTCRYAFKSVLYSDFVRGDADYALSSTLSRACTTMRDRTDERTGVQNSGSLLFVERAQSTNRLIADEAALRDELIGLGFRAIRPETMCIAEQVRIFSGARMVAGFLGAGLANVNWCLPEAILHEFVPSHHQNPCFVATAARRGVRYWGSLIETGVMTEDHVSQATRPIAVAPLIERTRSLLSAA